MCTVLCWGANSYGQLGTGDKSDRASPESVYHFTECNNTFVLSGGGSHSIIHTNGLLYTCGCNAAGQTGRITELKRFFPIERLSNEADGSVQIASISCGWDFSLVLFSNGRVYAWGSNSFGQLGFGEIDRIEPIPKLLPTLLSIKAVSAGLRHVIAVSGDFFNHFRNCYNLHAFASSADGSVFTWGCNRRNQLGIPIETYVEVGSVQNKPLRIKLNHLTGGMGIPKGCAAGANHSAIFLDDGTVLVWGEVRYFTEACDSRNTTSSTPVVFESACFGGQLIVQLVSGWSHLVARTDRGELYSWGRSDLGQLGRISRISSSTAGTPQFDPTPGVVTLIEDAVEECSETTVRPLLAVSVASGSEHVLVIDATHQHLWCWGWNEHGMCGVLPATSAVLSDVIHGDAEDKRSSSIVHLPTLVPLPGPNGTARVRCIGAGYGHSMAAF